MTESHLAFAIHKTQISPEPCNIWWSWSLDDTDDTDGNMIAMMKLQCVTHWGRVTHICISNLTITGSDNSLSPGRRQAIIWTNAGILLIWHLGTNFSEILIEIHAFSFKKIHLKMSSGKWRPFCLGLNVLTQCGLVTKYGITLLGQHWFRSYCLLGARQLHKLVLTYWQSGP